MKIVVRTVQVLTDASGDFSSDVFTQEGLLMRISYKPDGASPLATGADLTITETNTGLTLYTQANIGTSPFTKLPRNPICSAADGVDSSTLFDYIPVNDRLTLTIAQGGNALSGTFFLVFGV